MMNIKKQGCTYDGVLLPPNCVNGEGVTLDDMTVPQMVNRPCRFW